MNDPLINIQTNKDEEIINNNNSINKVNTFYLKYYPCKKSEVLVNQLLNNIEDYVFGVNSTLNRKNKLDKTKLRKCVLSFIQNINHSIKNNHDTILISLDCSYFAKPLIFNGKHIKEYQLSYRYMQILLDFMVQQEYIELNKGGFVGYNFNQFTGEQEIGETYPSEIIILDSLKELLSPHSTKISSEELYRSRSTVVLKDSNKQQIEFRLTKELKNLVETMERYNNQLCGRVRYADYDKPLDLFFNKIFNGDFDKGGRYYEIKGEIQTMNLVDRAKLTIDGENVVELDFKCLHPSMLYEKEEINWRLWSGDDWSPYYTPLNYYPPKTMRALCKKAMLRLINTKGSVKGAAIGLNQDIAHDLKRIKEGLPSAFHLVESGLVGKGIAATEIVKSLSYENGPICHYFGTGVGLELQNLDSKIADYIVDRFTQEDEVVISIHDSFICRESLESFLEQTMIEAYEFVMGSKLNCYIEKK